MDYIFSGFLKNLLYRIAAAILVVSVFIGVAVINARTGFGGGLLDSPGRILLVSFSIIGGCFVSILVAGKLLGKR